MLCSVKRTDRALEFGGGDGDNDHDIADSRDRFWGLVVRDHHGAGQTL